MKHFFFAFVIFAIAASLPLGIVLALSCDH
jgi:hypothetical protein